MLKKIIPVFIVIVNLGSISAQTFIGKLNPYPANVPSVLQANDTIRILGIMVNFQEDRDGATFGNGKFGSIYSSDYGNTILDPLPHNKSYFEAHLEFVKNYFDKVSRGKTVIEYFVLPDTFSVSQTMRNYAPEPNSDDFNTLAAFSQEVWNIADAAYPDFDFSSYDVFTIFHAGVGRDVTLPGSVGDERDLPSVYLGINALKNILGETFNGFPVSDGTFKITNSMIIPETESRELQTFSGKILFELSINGLLVASMASHMGLPDLFNTETGLSAIGRFGLMDSQAIFAYSGTFPPEPSAWEKIYLGWEEPFTISPGEFNINLVTKNAALPGDTVILKVPINSSEYYLVENRIRDANSDGAKITYILDGQTKTKLFTKDTTGFQSFELDSVNGVVINVDEYDWAIPNSISVENTPYDPKPGGGIVIWHIDEDIITERIGEDKINVDKNFRGVDVEEADGVQDIGEKFSTVFGDEIIGEGFVEDFWYVANPSALYENKFSKDTRPNTNTNSGANSLITFSNFSDLGNRMSFKVSYGDSLIKPLFSHKITAQSTEHKINIIQKNNGFSFAIVADKDLYRFNSLGELTDTLMSFSEFKTASVVMGNTEYIVGAINRILNVYMNDGVQDYLASVDVGEKITAPAVIRVNETDEAQIVLGTLNGKILVYSPGSLPSNDPELINSIVTEPVILIEKLAADASYFSFIGNYKATTEPPVAFTVFGDSNNKTVPFEDETPTDLAITKDKNGNYISIVLTDRNRFYVISDGNIYDQFEINSEEQIKSFALGDLKQDGENYIIFNNSKKLEAVNLQGATAENFPFIDPFNVNFSGIPLTTDFEGDNKAEIIVSTVDGRIFAVDGGTGKVINGFPISAGSKISGSPVLFKSDGKTSILAVNQENLLYAWSISATEGTLFWSEENGNGQNTSSTKAASGSNFNNEFFPENRVYNYPNPVYDDVTYIRYYVAEDSKINIKIFDLAGGFVAELNDDALGGFDNETQWNVSDVQSGVYLARIEAIGLSGKSESNIIKVAIIK
jgi:hypothetical protein